MTEDANAPETELAEAAREHTRREGATALRNGARLGVSLMLTWAVALVITFRLPSYLGPLHWGYYKYGLEYATALAVFLHLGVDTYISREIPVRPKHASDFFMGVVVTRMLLVFPLFAYGFVHLAHKEPEERFAALVFGVTQLFIVANATFQQILQAASTVGRLAIANVVAKVLWGGGTFAAVLLHAPFWMLPFPMLASESIKAVFLYLATRESVDLKLHFDFKETKRVLRASLPFFVAIAAVYLGSSLDVVLLRELVPDKSEEVGWYSAAREIARLSAMMMPVITGVVVPMMSRAMHNDEKEFFWIVRRGMEGVIVISLPLTLMLALGAEPVITLVLRDQFTPAAYSLQWLAPTFVLAYVNSLLWLTLMIMKRSWTITIVSFIGLVLLPLFIFLAVPLTRALGPGRSGMGVAMALSAREFVNVLIFLFIVGRRAFDQRSMLSITKSLGICGSVVALHVLVGNRLHPTSLFWSNWLRLGADGLLYTVLALGTGVLKVGDIKSVLGLVKNRRQLQDQAAEAEAEAKSTNAL